MQAEKRIDHTELQHFYKTVLLQAGVPEEVAAIEAAIGAEVDLCGVHTHGARLLPATVEKLEAGILQTSPAIERVAEYPASVLLKTTGGLGRYTSAHCMGLAIEKASQFGIGSVAVRGVGHWGRAYSYALQAARRGYVGLAFTNAVANFPAWGTAAPSLGNNPIAVGIPAADGQEPAVLDLAMTQASIGRVRMAAEASEKVPLGWGLDTAGEPTRDPQAIIDSGRYLPMGGHKGSGLAFMVEMLSAGLAGGPLCFEQGQGSIPTDVDGGSSKLFIAIRPWDNALGQRLQDLKDHLGEVPSDESGHSAQWPGQGSFFRRRDYLQNGIALPDALASDLEKLGRDLAVSLNWKS
jgi:LDH2 family malate/lactate/ureidoglycolate dehydrogenase